MLLGRLVPARALRGLLLLLAPALAHAQPTFLRITTDNNPPLAYAPDAGGFSGLTVDALKHMAALADVTLEFQLLPWPRAYATHGKEPNTCLTGMGRTREREPNYQWVGPFAKGGMALLGLPGRPLTVKSMDDVVRQGLTVGVAKNDMAAAVTERTAGLKVETFALAKLGPRMLEHKRFDLWATGAILGRYRAKEEGVPVMEALTVEPIEVSLGCSHSTDPAVIKRLQTALDSMRKSGALKALQDKYLGVEFVAPALKALPAASKAK